MHWLPLVAMVIASALPFPHKPAARIAAALLPPPPLHRHVPDAHSHKDYNSQKDYNSAPVDYNMAEQKNHRDSLTNSGNGVFKLTNTMDAARTEQMRTEELHTLDVTGHVELYKNHMDVKRAPEQRTQDQVSQQRTQDQVSQQRTQDQVSQQRTQDQVSQQRTQDQVSQQRTQDQVSQQRTQDQVSQQRTQDQVSQQRTQDQVSQQRTQDQVSQQKTQDQVSQQRTQDQVSQQRTQDQVSQQRTQDQVLELDGLLDSDVFWDAHPRVMFSPSPPQLPPLALMEEGGWGEEEEEGTRRHRRSLTEPRWGQRSVCESVNVWVTDKTTAVDTKGNSVSIIQEIQTQSGPIKQYFYETRCRQAEREEVDSERRREDAGSERRVEETGVDGGSCLGIDKKQWRSRCIAKPSFVRALTKDANNRMGWRWIRIDASCVCVLLSRTNGNRPGAGPGLGRVRG